MLFEHVKTIRELEKEYERLKSLAITRIEKFQLKTEFTNKKMQLYTNEKAFLHTPPVFLQLKLNTLLEDKHFIHKKVLKLQNINRIIVFKQDGDTYKVKFEDTEDLKLEDGKLVMTHTIDIFELIKKEIEINNMLISTDMINEDLSTYVFIQNINKYIKIQLEVKKWQRNKLFSFLKTVGIRTLKWKDSVVQRVQKQ